MKKPLYKNYVVTAQDKKGIPNLYQSYLVEFAERVFVVCDNCNQLAVICVNSLVPITEKSKATFRCRFCAGFKEVKLHAEFCQNKNTDNKKNISAGIVLGLPIDPFFRIPLFLQSSFKNYTIWAYNEHHLICLIDFVASKMRPNKAGKNLNASIASRLPHWMILSTNREGVLKKLHELQRKLNKAIS